MAIIKQLNKKTGITYVYESRSYRDKETKQPRSERRLIGRIDDETGEIVPTRKKQKSITTNAVEGVATTTENGTVSADMEAIREMEATITMQRREIVRLQKEKEEAVSMLEKLLAMLKA